MMSNPVKSVDEFMRRKLVTLAPETKVLDGVAKLLKDNISGAPVTDGGGNYLGVFSEKSCMNALTEAVEDAHAAGMHLQSARQFMTTDLTTLSPGVDVFEAIDHILSKRISGAPVLGGDGRFEGIFSEKTAMQVLVSAAYDQLPGTNVGAYMNTDRNRIVEEDATVLDVAHKFQETPYRRLPVLKGDSLAGQISRRDVIREEHRIAKDVAKKAETSAAPSGDARTDHTVDEFKDDRAKTIGRNDDVLHVAQIFLNSPYRRLPVVENGKLIGQVSRRDLLGAAADLLRPASDRRPAATLYFSGVAESMPPSF